jgi:hypothetical protein
MKIAITGNTYPVRDKLRALGGLWDKPNQAWLVDESKADEARAIVSAAGPSQPYRRTRRVAYAGYSRFSSGAVSYRNPRGRCEDAPCCGCCS